MAERPVCHFELPPSTLKGEREDLKIIEFSSLGTKIKNTKRFYIVNATASSYEFEWRQQESNKETSCNYFKCATMKGTVLSGKKYEVIFEYSPEQPGTHQAYYSFRVPEFKVEQTFLIHGIVNEPRVFLDTGKVNFGPLLLGGRN